jgi:alanyl-tRNA synthetase
MAETGPCGPCSEIHIDRGPGSCDKAGVPGHVCQVNGDCKRYLELWNLVFIQYNRLNVDTLEPLPAKHVDTGMGLERIVSIMQGVTSNYLTDLLSPLMKTVQVLAGHNENQMQENFTPYRVIADHARATTFLIADGVVPGNTGRNYITRMIIRRASRFGGKLGLNKPFLAEVAETVIDQYGGAYPELLKNRKTILDNITREESRFHRTIESGMGQLEDYINDLKGRNITRLDGERAFELYATHGLPLELTRDILQEQGLSVDEVGFKEAMDDHRIASGAGKAMGEMGGEDVSIYSSILDELTAKGKLKNGGVLFDPYTKMSVEGEILAIVKSGEPVDEAIAGEEVEIVLPETCFYIESGGQVADRGKIATTGETGIFNVVDVRKPAAGIIIHIGKVRQGKLKVGDKTTAQVDFERRQDIRRNHTATHLLHAELHKVVGKHALQAGSMVSPERLRFDFNHPEAVTSEQLELIETGVNQYILENYKLEIKERSLQDAMNEGATALFGEKYGDVVRTVVIGNQEPISFELCGGTHVAETGDIGLFLITSEGSTAAGVRRIEAVTGRAAYTLVQQRTRLLKRAAALLQTSLEEIPAKIELVLSEAENRKKQASGFKAKLAEFEFQKQLMNVQVKNGASVFGGFIPEVDMDTLRLLCDLFIDKYPSGGVILATDIDGKPSIVVSISDDLVKRGLNAGEVARAAAQIVGGNGGGRPNLAQAGGKDASKIDEAIKTAIKIVMEKL